MKRCLLCLGFLIVLLVASFPFPIQAQEPDTYYVNVECSELYRLRGETLIITTLTNSSSFVQQIIAPNGTLLYNQTRTSNMTFVVPINAAYGTYTIKSIVNGNEASTWLTVLDVSGWSLAVLPYTRQHNNMNYTFFGNWTVKVQLFDEEMFIDLSKLRDWKDQFGLDVTALKNSMNFLVRFSKAPYFALDLTFSFIHSGCKIIVNGTQDQAREFTFHFDAKRFNSWLDGIRTDHLIFDWSDIPKTAYTYDGTAKLLTVYIPETFRVDPYIFEDGFESGNFSAWTGTGGTPTIDSDPHHGTNSVKCNASNNYCYKDITAAPILYSRFYMKLTTDIPSGQLCFFCKGLDIPGGPAWGWQFALFNDGGTKKLYLDGASGVTTANFVWSAGVWYCFEIKFDTTNDNYGVWVDGTRYINVNETSTLAVTRLYFGTIDTIYTLGDINIDCVVVDDEYIGVEGGATSLTWNGSATLTFVESYLTMISFNRAGISTLAFTVNSLKTFSFSRAGTATLTFIANIFRTLDLTRHGTASLTFTVNSIVQGLGTWLNFYGSAPFTFTVQKTISGIEAALDYGLVALGIGIIALVVAGTALAIKKD